MMTDLVLDRVHVRFEHGAEVLAGVTLAVAGGEFVAVVGRSGSGKTTLLNLAAGFLAPTAGSVRVDGRPVTGPGADRAVVFQDDALFPWLTASENVSFALRLAGIPARERRRTAEELLHRVGLAGAADRRIWELSGGMRQRVGIARALAAEPRFLLLDEPFGALDALTRARMQDLLVAICGATSAGAILITHSIDEAILLADRVVVLAPAPVGIIADVAVPFRRRIVAGEPAREARTDPVFSAFKEQIMALVGVEIAGEPA